MVPVQGILEYVDRLLRYIDPRARPFSRRIDILFIDYRSTAYYFKLLITLFFRDKMANVITIHCIMQQSIYQILHVPKRGALHMDTLSAIFYFLRLNFLRWILNRRISKKEHHTEKSSYMLD